MTIQGAKDMAAAGEGVEKLEDMIVRAAETTASHVTAAKAAVGSVIFGQEKVVERTLITVLCAVTACWSVFPA